MKKVEESVVYKGRKNVLAAEEAKDENSKKWLWFIDVSGEAGSYEEACLAIEKECPRFKGEVKQYFDKKPSEDDVFYDLHYMDASYNLRAVVSDQ